MARFCFTLGERDGITYKDFRDALAALEKGNENGDPPDLDWLAEGLESVGEDVFSNRIVGVGLTGDEGESTFTVFDEDNGTAHSLATLIHLMMRRSGNAGHVSFTTEEPHGAYFITAKSVQSTRVDDWLEDRLDEFEAEKAAAISPR